MDQQNLPMNSNSLKSRFTRNFLESLMKINRQAPTSSPSSSSPREIFHRYHRVKVAAYKSMVRAVGSRSFWSRAMLSRIRNQNRQKGFAKRIRIDAFLRRKYRKEKNIYNNKHHHHHQKNKKEEVISPGEADELRKVVPGGGAMDLCSLLSETADYIKCLNTQVEAMRSIVDLYST